MSSPPPPPLSRSSTLLASSEISLITQAENFVRSSLVAHDSSHDFNHIDRVRRNAREIALEEGNFSPEDLELIELAALLHDVGDWKYSRSDLVGPAEVRKFLFSLGVEEKKISLIVEIVENIGFKKELKGLNVSEEVYPLLAVVQDADRLDAIGAIGVARCFTFGGARNRPIIDDQTPTSIQMISAEKYEKNDNSSSITHFYEKLLRLKSLMKTKAGKRRAEQRTEFMNNFLEQFHSECKGEK